MGQQNVTQGHGGPILEAVDTKPPRKGVLDDPQQFRSFERVTGGSLKPHRLGVVSRQSHGKNDMLKMRVFKIYTHIYNEWVQMERK